MSSDTDITVFFAHMHSNPSLPLTSYSFFSRSIHIGAVTSMHDALALANLIYALPSNPTSNDITQAFSEYQTERIPHVMESFENSQLLSKFMNRNITGWVAFFLMKGLPGWVFRITKRKMVQNRPTAGWLQEVDVRGTVAPDVSPSTEKARVVFWERQQGGFK